MTTKKKTKKKIKYPATCVSHWATGGVNTCEKHAKQLVYLGKIMGAHVPITTLDKPAECINCINEN